VRTRVFALALLVAPRIASAQTPHARVNDLAFSVAIGGATGAITAAIHGQSIWTGAWRGLAGGSIMSAARQLAGSQTEGAGLAAREISAVGVSLAAAGGDSVIHWLIPVGPATIIVGPHSSVDWRLNLTQAASAVGLAVSPNTRFDFQSTLYSGAPVYRDRRPHFGESGSKEFLGAEQLGTIRLAPEASDPLVSNSARALPHETIHVLQEDYLNDAVTLPIERAVLRTFPLGRLFARHLDVGLLTPLLGNAASQLIPYTDRPWEREAYSLTGQSISK
jgi:hypothetical protein